jgi:hypothetical protein
MHTGRAFALVDRLCPDLTFRLHYATWSCSALSSRTVAILFEGATDYYFTPVADPSNPLNQCNLEEQVGYIGGNLQLSSKSMRLTGNLQYHAHWTGSRWVFDTIGVSAEENLFQ